MTIDLARKRRIEALSKRSSDRILVKPARHVANMQLPDEGTLAAYIIGALIKGVTAENITAKTGWSKSRVMVTFYDVAKKTGVGINRKDDVLSLILPDNADGVFDESDYMGTADISMRDVTPKHDTRTIVLN